MKNITTFYVEAVIRKGAPANLLERIAEAESAVYAEGGANYKIEFFLGDDSDDERFTIYGDGTAAYDSPNTSISAKLSPPHSKTWIRRMVKTGMEVDYAKMVWAECYSIRHGGNGRML